MVSGTGNNEWLLTKVVLTCALVPASNQLYGR